MRKVKDKLFFSFLKILLDKLKQMIYIADTKIGRKCFFGHKTKQLLDLGAEMKEIAEKEKNDVMDFNTRLPGWMGRKIKEESKAGMMAWSTRIRQIIAAHYEKEGEKVEAR